MANDVKWIKFMVGTFDGMSFKRVKRAKIDGVINFRDKLTAVWFELLDLGGKVNNQGFLVNDEFAFRNYEDIAIVLDRTTEEVEMCIKWFVTEGMMKIIDDIFLISNWEKYQNTEGLEKIRLQNRERQQRFRENKKKLSLELKEEEKQNSNVTHNVVVTKPSISNSLSLISNSLNNKPNTNNTIIKEHINIIIEYLNIKARKKFKNVESNAKFIRARFEEGYTVDDLKQVIDTKVADWLDTEQAKYLRPETLFNATKFQSYINQKPKERVEEKNVPTNRY